MFKCPLLLFLLNCCFVCGQEEESAPDSSDSSSLSPMNKLILYAAAAGTFIILGICFLWCDLRQKRSKLVMPTNIPSMQFEAQELHVATRGYHTNNLMGSTQWGSLFKAVLQDGSVVAVKRLNLNNSDESNHHFRQVCNDLTDVHHRNLVRVLGFSLGSDDFMHLVVEYLDWKSLHQLFHQNLNLSWDTRLKIVQGIACGLLYLHEERGTCNNNNSPFVHGDLKPSNIFVDMDDQEPLLSDYGIYSLIEKYSDFTSAFRGLGGYAAPECKRSDPATPQSDVYSYGVIILQLLTLKVPTSEEVSQDLPGWVRYKLPYGLGEVIDDSIFKDASELKRKMMKRVLGVGLMCTREDPYERPSMKEVLEMLIQIKGFTVNSNSNLNSGYEMEQV